MKNSNVLGIDFAKHVIRVCIYHGVSSFIVHEPTCGLVAIVCFPLEYAR